MSEEIPTHLRPEGAGSAAAYWEGACRGKLLLPRCTACGGALAWIEASGRGVVHTYTVVRQNADPWLAARLPYVVAMIDLDEGPRLMTNVVGCDVDAVRIGMPVAVAFLDVGADVRLPVFEPCPAR